MTISTIVVQIELDGENDNLLRVTRDCARLFNASVIGVAATQMMLTPTVGAYVASDLIEQDEVEIKQETVAAEARFRAALADGVSPLEWRSTFGFQSNAAYVARQARVADLILAGARLTPPMFDRSRSVDVGGLVMEAGRPVLIVPAAVRHLAIGTILVASKPSREFRRAIADALPFLQKADRVIVVEVTAKERLVEAKRGLEDVAAWLLRHAVETETRIVLSSGDDAEQLHATAHEVGADIIVAGAYGHSRVREWALGGVTRDLLMHPTVCTLVSH